MREMKQKSAGVVGAMSPVAGKIRNLTPPPKIRPWRGSERVKKSNERRGAVSGVQINQVERERESSERERNDEREILPLRSAHMLCFTGEHKSAAEFIFLMPIPAERHAQQISSLI